MDLDSYERMQLSITALSFAMHSQWDSVEYIYTLLAKDARLKYEKMKKEKV